jgi:hypothetical protein
MRAKSFLFVLSHDDLREKGPFPPIAPSFNGNVGDDNVRTSLPDHHDPHLDMSNISTEACDGPVSPS